MKIYIENNSENTGKGNFLERLSSAFVGIDGISVCDSIDDSVDVSLHIIGPKGRRGRKQR